jgi:uncharacterized protein YdaU (DUF1376 family)
MIYYPHHIGDFNNATRHLNRLERGIYRDLIDLYYETEKPLTSDLATLCRRILANEFSTDVERLLNEFFIETSEGWYHDRCDHEIGLYRANNSQKAMAGKASAAAREAKRQRALNGLSTEINGCSTDVETPLNGTPTNQEPITNNQEPRKSKAIRASAIPKPDGISESLWADFERLRKAKRAAITQTALDGIRREADKVGLTLEAALRECCERSWQGFKAEWYLNSTSKGQGNAKPSRESSHAGYATVEPV